MYVRSNFIFSELGIYFYNSPACFEGVNPDSVLPIQSWPIQSWPIQSWADSVRADSVLTRFSPEPN